MLKKPLFFCGVLAVLSYSCMLQDEAENFVHVEQQVAPPFIADLHYAYYGTASFYIAKDTFWLAQGEHVQFHFSGPDFVYRVVAELDGKTIVDEDMNPYWALTAEGLTEGPHQLKVTQYVKSGTGSLADKLDSETASHTESYVVMAGAFEFTPIIESIEVADEGVKIKWNAYEKSNFQDYEIRRYVGPLNFVNSYDSYKRLTVTDQAQTSFTDTTYLGGTKTYFVAVDLGGKWFTSAPKEITFSDELNMRLAPAGPNRAILSWDHPRFYKNARSMKLYKTQGLSSQLLVDNMPPSQTSVEIDYTTVFGLTSTFRLEMAADAENHGWDNTLSVGDQLMPGVRIPRINLSGDIEYNEGEDAYYIACDIGSTDGYPQGYYRLDKDLHVTDTLRGSAFGDLITSPDGNRIFVLQTGSLLQLEGVPLAVKESYNLGVSVSTSGQWSAVSNNGYILHRTQDNVRVLDFATKTVLLDVPIRDVAHLSPDGQYVANGPDLYQFDGAQFQPAGTLPFSDIRFLHFPNSGDRLLIATPDKLTVYDHINGANIVQYDFPTNVSAHPEFNNKSMTYFTRGANLSLINITNGEQRTVRVNYAETVTIEGEYLFSHSGYGLKPY